MIFDSGSQLMWISSLKCDTCPENFNKFDEKDSELVVGSAPGKIEYGSGSADGLFYRD